MYPRIARLSQHLKIQTIGKEKNSTPIHDVNFHQMRTRKDYLGHCIALCMLSMGLGFMSEGETARMNGSPFLCGSPFLGS